MSTEYIERGAAIKTLIAAIHNDGFGAQSNIDRHELQEDEVEDAIRSIPAADVEPVVRAKWEREFKEVPVKDGSRCVMKVLYKCAGEYGCKEYSIINSKRCPKCGAHMDERSDEK